MLLMMIATMMPILFLLVARTLPPTLLYLPTPRAWTLSSELLSKLTKQGIDPLRDSGVREALKRLVKDSIEGLASRYPKPVAVSIVFIFHVYGSCLWFMLVFHVGFMFHVSYVS